MAGICAPHLELTASVNALPEPACQACVARVRDDILVASPGDQRIARATTWGIEWIWGSVGRPQW